MKKILIYIIIWIVLILTFFVQIFNYNIFKLFFNTDILLLASILLLFYGMIWTSFVFTFIYSFALDSIFMNFLGINLISYMLTLLFIFYLCKNMNIENLLTKIFIIFVSCLLKIAIYTMLIYLFYWEGKLYFIPSRIFFNVVFTIIFGAVIVWISDLVKRWFAK